MNDIDRELRNILKDIVENERLKASIDTEDNLEFIRDLEFDSVDIMKLVVELEEKFHVKISEENDFLDILKDIRSVKKWLEDRYEKRIN